MFTFYLFIEKYKGSFCFLYFGIVSKKFLMFFKTKWINEISILFWAILNHFFLVKMSWEGKNETFTLIQSLVYQYINYDINKLCFYIKIINKIK